MTLVLNTVLKRYGALNVFGGMLGGECVAPYSLGAQMRAFDAGFSMQAPADNFFSGYEQRLFYGWMVVYSADFPAAAKMLPTSTSVGALRPCRQCDWERLHDDAKKPTSFVQPPQRWTGRTTEAVAAQIQEATEMQTVGARNEHLKAHGLFQLEYAFEPHVLPHFKALESTPQDVMHAEFSSGTANTEAAAMLYIFISREKWFKVDDLNTAISEYDWPPGHKPPLVYPSIVKGDCHGCPTQSANLHYSGAGAAKRTPPAAPVPHATCTPIYPASPPSPTHPPTHTQVRRLFISCSTARTFSRRSSRTKSTRPGCPGVPMSTTWSWLFEIHSPVAMFCAWTRRFRSTTGCSCRYAHSLY